VFAVVGTLGSAPVVIYLAMGERSAELCWIILKAWMDRSNAVIMAELCLVIGSS